MTSTAVDIISLPCPPEIMRGKPLSIESMKRIPKGEETSLLRRGGIKLTLESRLRRLSRALCTLSR